MRSIDVIAAGHLCLDIIPEFPKNLPADLSKIFIPGKLININPSKINSGGTVSNTGLAMNKFGLKLAVMAGVGDDLYGNILIELFEQRGIKSAIRATKGEPTSYTIVLAPEGIDRMLLHCPGTNDTFCSADIDFDLVGNSRLFHLGYPPLMRRLYEDGGEELEKIYRIAKAKGATTSLDMSLPDPNSDSGRVDWRAILKRLLPHVDLFLPSMEEIFFMLDKERYQEIRQIHPNADFVDCIEAEDCRRLARQALEFGCGVCAIKVGRRGYYLLSGGKDRLAGFGSEAALDLEKWSNAELWAPAYHIDRIVSAAGSGDSSIAGFLTAFLKGHDPARCMKLACATGQHNLRALDTLSGLPDWESLEKFVDASPRVIDPSIDSTQFKLDREAGMYSIR